MKVVCTIDHVEELTFGKTYDVLCTGGISLDNVVSETVFYRIINNQGCMLWYEKGLFKQLFEIRDEKIEKILEE